MTTLFQTVFWLLLATGFTLGLTKYRKTGGWLLIGGFLMLGIDFIIMLQGKSRCPIPAYVLICLEVTWNIAGTAAILLRRMGQTGWKDLAKAVGLGSIPTHPDEFARLGEACRQTSRASIDAGLIFSIVAVGVFVANSLDGTPSFQHLYRFPGNALMPMLCAYLISEWRFGTLEQNWRGKLPLDHPERFSPPITRWWIYEVFFGGLFCISWAAFAGTGIPQRWIP